MEGFSIRIIETEAEFESIVVKWMAEEKWRPGLKDAECFLACDPSGTLVGELNGKPICCVAITKYGDNFGFIGMYIVRKEYRGKGYGLTIFNAAIERVKPTRTPLALYSVLHREKMYQKKGFQSHCYGARFDFDVPTAISCLSEISEQSPVSVQCLDQVDHEALFAYDSHTFGFPRHAFLSKWLRVPGSQAHVATDGEGSVVGYVVARPTFVKEEGFKIGPLFADSVTIAEKLLKAVIEELQEEEPVPAVCIYSFTEKGKLLASRLQGKRSLDCVYMTTAGFLPKACFDKWFGVTTLETG